MRSRPWLPAAFLTTAGLALPITLAVVHAIPDKVEPANPVANDCSGGYVEFTFDDGPGRYTRKLTDRLNALHIKGTFFVIGRNIEDGGPKAAALLRDMVAAGHSVQNHTYDHSSITGESTKKAPLTRDRLVQELDRGTRAIRAAGLPRPTLYRPPYGDIDAPADDVARGLGYRLVSPWGITDSNIVDSRDWAGASTQEIISNVTNGYTSDGYRLNGITDKTIVTMHDGGDQDTLHSIAALQPIADYMNAHHLCSTTTIRPDATGGRVPAPPLPEPAPAANLVHNPSLETAKKGEPACFERAANDTGGVAAQWSRTADAHTGKAAEQVVVTSTKGGDRKLVVSRDPSGSPCLAAVEPGRPYATWLWYKGDWPAGGATKTDVDLVVYYRVASGEWEYWETGPALEPSATWKLANYVTAPLPKGATAVSFGFEITGTGTVAVDDYSMAPR